MLYNQPKPRYYFPIPNEIFHLELSDGAMLVYMFLMYCEDRKTYTCHPSYATIGKYIHRSDNSIAKYVRELEEKCLIYTEPTEVMLKDGRKHNGTLKYTIRPIADAVTMQCRCSACGKSRLVRKLRNGLRNTTASTESKRIEGPADRLLQAG